MKKLLQSWTLPLVAMMAVAACGESTPTGVVEECDPADPACNPTGTTDPPLEVMQVSPADGAGGIETSADVTVTFNRAVAAASVTATSFRVGTVTGDRAVSGTTVTFTPASPFAEGTDYDVVVDGVTDAGGVGLESAFSSSFTTLTLGVMADAGPDFDVSMGAEATLDKGASTGTGATFTWTQLSGPGVGALSGSSPTFTAPDEVADLAFELEVSDGTTTEVDTVRVWVLENAAQAIWVAESGSPSNPGTRTAPLASIQAAITAADNAGNGADVYIAAGNYAETLTLRSRVSLYGGFDAADWSRDIDANRPVVSGDAVAVSGTAANDLTVEGLEILAADAVGVGASSIAVRLVGSNGVLLARNVVISGAGTVGAPGSPGVTGAKGSDGGDGSDAKAFCSGTAGGGGGQNYRAGGGGGKGGALSSDNGGAGAGTHGGTLGGGGTSGSKNGGGGGNGKQNGTSGAEGAAGAAFGEVSANGYDASAAVGGTGSKGGAGYGGGGGGGAFGYVGVCGPSGGGGGGGGEGGTGGTGGTGGGASIGVLLIGQTVAQLTDNDISTGTGGKGGAGGGAGGGGGRGWGGDGGNAACEWPFDSPCTGYGGDGGDGSFGGRGGYGGGGGGGPSIGVLEEAGATGTLSGNVFTLGAGGAGGFSSGNTGLTGETANHKKLN